MINKCSHDSKMTTIAMPVRLVLVAALIGFVLARSVEQQVEKVPVSDDDNAKLDSSTLEKRNTMHDDGRQAASEGPHATVKTVITHKLHSTHHKKREAHDYKKTLDALQPGCCG